jgi:bifunctional non-homologous end joining protein LigD
MASTSAFPRRGRAPHPASPWENVNVPAPYEPMLLSAGKTPPGGDGWAHEPKLDGWRAIIQVTGGRARLWSRTGREWTGLPELAALGALGEVVLDSEGVVTAADGRADFDQLGARMHGRTDTPAAVFYVFDAISVGDVELLDRPWSERRKWLDDLGLTATTGGVARPTIWSLDGQAVHRATADIGAEGTVSKRMESRYRPGQRTRSWVKAKHRRTGVFQVVGWRPTTKNRMGGLIVAEDSQGVGIAGLALPEPQRSAVVELICAHGRHHASGYVTIPVGTITATVSYTARTPTHGRLREAVASAVHPGP